MPQTKVILHGELADIACSEFVGEIRTTRDAVRLLEVNYPKLRPYLQNAHQEGIAFTVRADDWELSEEDLLDPVQGRTIHIAPIPLGSGNVFKVILGVALLGLGIAGIGFLGLSPLMTGVMGGLMIISGLMGGKPAAPDPNDENTKSFIFNGAVNTVAVGARVPIAYGYEIIVGSYVLSANIRTFSING